jgi:hypothetical protein
MPVHLKTMATEELFREHNEMQDARSVGLVGAIFEKPDSD